MRHPILSLVPLVLAAGLVTLHAQQFTVSSSDLDIPPGSKVIVDGTVRGTAPLSIAVKFNTRHKITTEVSGMKIRELYVTAKEVEKSKEVDRIPAWFVNPSLHQSDFSGYTSLIPATVFSSTIHLAVKGAEDAARSKMPGGMLNRYNTVRASQGRLDSSSSSYYPNLTRGQMDSLNDVNGGRMVLESFPASAVEFLEYEIQKMGEGYRVYVLAGRR